MCFLNLNWLSIVMLNRLTLSAEQETILPLMIKIKRYSCLVQDQWSKITQVYSTGTDLKQYNMKKNSRKTVATIKFISSLS